MLRAILFDIDDTLSDWETAIDRALSEALTARDYRARRIREAIDRYALVIDGGIVIDRRYWLLLLDPVPPFRDALPDAGEQPVGEMAHRFRSLLRPVPYPDAQPALAQLSESYALGVLSNNPRSEGTLSSLGLRQFFGAVVAADDPWRKPHPEAFRQGLAAMGVSAGEAAYVGDSLDHDVWGALNAGLTPVWVDRWNTSAPPPDGAHRVDSLRALPELLSRLVP